MDVYLYTNYSDPLYVHKDIRQVGAKRQASLFEPADIHSPVLKLRWTEDMVNVNYVYIPEFHRYYFTKAPEMNPAHTVMLRCFTDVLMTALPYMDREVTAIRNEFEPTSMIVDRERIFTSDTDIEVFRFSGEFDSSRIGGNGFACYALSLIG